jgi:hypothetical protein
VKPWTLLLSAACSMGIIVLFLEIADLIHAGVFGVVAAWVAVGIRIVVAGWFWISEIRKGL